MHGWMSGAGVGWDMTVHSQWKVGRQAGGCVVAEAGDGFSLLNEPGSKTIIGKGSKGRGQGGIRVWRKWEVVT